jgi:hypothetical protein
MAIPTMYDKPVVITAHGPMALAKVLSALVASFVLGSLLLGCGPSGPPIAQVSGKVTSNGQPVPVGEVIFITDAGYGSSGSLRDDGTFLLVSHLGKGIPPGEYMVAVTPPDPDSVPESERAALRALNFDNIPARYRNFSTSGLTAVVEEGANYFEFDLKP